jgi:hypothetical protein
VSIIGAPTGPTDAEYTREYEARLEAVQTARRERDEARKALDHAIAQLDAAKIAYAQAQAWADAKQTSFEKATRELAQAAQPMVGVVDRKSEALTVRRAATPPAAMPSWRETILAAMPAAQREALLADETKLAEMERLYAEKHPEIAAKANGGAR